MSALRFLLRMRKGRQSPLRISLVQSPSVSSDDEALLWCSDPARVLHLPADQGVIIGRLFSRETFSAIEEMTAAEAARLVDSGGAALIKDYWGAYVAVHQSDDVGGYSIIRAPSGFLPCYQVETHAHHIWASDLHTLSAAGIAVSKVDWERLYEHLQWPDVRRRHSCIDGVSELAPGSARTVSGHEAGDRMLWEPWIFVHPNMAIDPDQAVTRLRDTVFASVSALASDYQNIIVGVSGGLDSSIVCAALTRGGHRFSCLTMATTDASGDERRYAASVAAVAGVPLAAHQYAVDNIDLSRSSAAHLPRPVGRPFLQELDRAYAAETCKNRADAIFTGNGGDNVFCFLHSAAPVVDRFRQEKGLKPAWNTLLDMCRVTQCDIPTMARAAFNLSRTRSSLVASEPDLTLLNAARAALAQSAPLTPYMDRGSGRFPGKLAHVRLLQRIQNFVEGQDRTTFPPMFPVLLAQPIVETCLRISSWQWCEGGINRSVARRAFGGFLPRQVVHRTSKAGPDSVTAAAFESGRPKLRELLLDGLLRQNRIIDAVAVEQALSSARTSRDQLLYRILDLADAEAWARSWSAGSSGSALDR
ncbi:MAG: hypothetical protein IE921_02035 [Rhodobacteraceae bacterium]|nr:hypothetical protein [Paracoccaceae bacterium]